MKKIFYLFVLAFINISCDNVYFKDRNPANLPTTNLPEEALGEYFAEPDDHLILTENEIDIEYNNGGSIYEYKDLFGANTDMPIFKLADSYMVSYNNPDKNDYYRIFVFDYHRQKGQIIVKEIFGKQKSDEKKESLSKLKSSKMLTDPDVAAGGMTDVDYLVNPSAKEFMNWFHNGAFEEVAVFQKKKFECENVEYSLECNEFDGFVSCDPSGYPSDVRQKINEYIEYYKSQKKAGIYKFSVPTGSYNIWIRMSVFCAD